jgi:hypothetical protein
MTEKKESNIDWTKIIIGLAFAALTAFGFSSYMKFKKEEERRIEAQNEIARQSKVIQETNDTWSRLAQQREDAIKILEKDNEKMAELLEERKEQILTLSTAVLKFKSIKFVIREGDANQEEQPDGRLRVDFNSVQDPVSVKGFTLTNPAHAELEVGFTRPLKLTTVVTQKPDGSWRSYVKGDYPNLEIEQIETVVNPLITQSKSFGDRIIVGFGVGPNLSFSKVYAEGYILADLDVLSVGPFLGGVDGAGAVVGLKAQFRPFQ